MRELVDRGGTQDRPVAKCALIGFVPRVGWSQGSQFYTVNGWLPRPIRICVKQIGRPLMTSSNPIATSKTGQSNTSPIIAPPRSSARFCQAVNAAMISTGGTRASYGLGQIASNPLSIHGRIQECSGEGPAAFAIRRVDSPSLIAAGLRSRSSPGCGAEPASRSGSE